MVDVLRGHTHQSSSRHTSRSTRASDSRCTDIQSPDGDVTVFSSAYQTWDKRNEIMLEQSFSADGWLDSTPKSDYANAFGLQYPFGVELADEVTVEGLASDLASKV